MATLTVTGDSRGTGECDGTGENFVDADGDGVCDNVGTGTGLRKQLWRAALVWAATVSAVLEYVWLVKT